VLTHGVVTIYGILKDINNRLLNMERMINKPQSQPDDHNSDGGTARVGQEGRKTSNEKKKKCTHIYLCLYIYFLEAKKMCLNATIESFLTLIRSHLPLAS
jgi:hypothetical protein